MKNFFARLRAGAAITINGQRFAGARNVTVQDGRIYVDGAEQSMDSSPAMNVSIQGDVEALEVGYGQVTVTGMSRVTCPLELNAIAIAVNVPAFVACN